MSLTGLLDLLLDERSGDPALRLAVEAARSGGRADLDLTAPPGIRPFALAALAGRAGRPVLAVTATGREAEDLAAALRDLLPPDAVVEFPAWETLPHERLSPRSDTVGRRLAVLRRLAHPDPPTSSTGRSRSWSRRCGRVLQPLVAGLGDLEPVALRPGDEVDLDDVVERLVDRRLHPRRPGREARRVRRARRHPRRLPADRGAPAAGRVLGRHGRGDPLVQGRRPALPGGRRARAVGAAVPRAAAHRPRCASGPPRWPSRTPSWPTCSTRSPRASRSRAWSRSRRCWSTTWSCWSTQLPAGTHVVLSATPSGSAPGPHDLVATSQEFLEASWANAAAGGGDAPIDLGAAAYRSLADVRDRAGELGMPWWSVSPFAADEEPDDEETSVVAARGLEGYRGDTARALADIKGWLGDGWRVVLVTEGHGPAERLVEVLGRRGHPGPARRVARPTRPTPALVHVACGCLGRGFVSEALRLAVLTETDLIGPGGPSTKDMRPAAEPAAQHRRPAAADARRLRRARAARRRPLRRDGAAHRAGRDPRVPRHRVRPGKRGQPGDRLFVPTDQLDQVTQYVGGEAPSLHRLGGADWPKTKGRASKAVKEIAAELIRLYTARMAAPGYAFGPDTPWQRELEDAFPYAETPDQLAAIDEVKDDMEKTVPMDRVICGDVGYGKTEIAVRAAFKAVQDGKQVAVLVPTTLLVQQHFVTFGERYASFPVKVAALSRFQTRQGGQRGPGGPARRHRRRRHRHPPAAVGRDAVQGPRPGHRRRGAALRRRAQGAPQAAAHQRRRAHDVGDADPAHPGDGGHRHPRDVDDPHPAGGAPPGADLRRPVRREADRAPRSAASCCARARSSTSTTGSSRSTGRPRGCASWCPRRGSRPRTAR